MSMEQVVGGVAAATGYVLRVLVFLVSWLPAIAGPSLVLYGAYQYSPPASYILAGLVVSLLTFVRPNRKGARRR
jgi:hypothetical protein